MSDLSDGWRRGNIRRFAAMKTGHTPSRSNPEYWDDTTIPWFTLADVWQLRDGQQTYLGDTANMISELGLENSAAELLPAGTVVLSRTASVGFSGIMPRPMATSQDFWNWVCGPELLPGYLNYQFKAIAPDLRALNMGSTHQTIYQKDAAAIEVMVPPVEVQRDIVAFLDREASQIDKLIADQRRLIKLLSERRQSVAAKVFGARVGVGDRLKWLVTESDVRAGQRASELPLMSVSISWGVRRRDEVTDEDTRVEDLSNYKVCREGELVINRMRAFQGALGLAPEDGIVSPDYAVMKIRGNVDALWLAAVMKAPTFVGELARRVKGIGSAELGNARTPRINVADLGEIRVDVPSLRQQAAERDDVARRVARILRLIIEAERFIELARERRSALITAAVTGQIDVRSVA